MGVWDLQQDASILGTFDTDPEVTAKSGEQISLRCSDSVSFMRPYCGEGENIFYVTSRVKHLHPSGRSSIYKLGFRELYQSLRWAQLTTGCEYKPPRSQDGLDLPIACAAVTGFGHQIKDVNVRILVCLTAKSIRARWLALASFPWTTITMNDGRDSRRILLRSSRCCCQCAMDQAALAPGKCFLIL